MKPLRRKKKKQGDNKILFIAAGALLAGAYWLFGGEKPVPTAPATPEPAVEPAPPQPAWQAAAKPVAAPETLAPAPSIPLEQRRMALVGATKVGISTLHLPVDPDGYMSIPFRFVPKKVWCQAGDIDTIRYSVSDPTKKEILVTIENVSGENRFAKINVSVEDLLKGFEHTFRVKTLGKGDSLGLFLCKSTDGKGGGCKGKPVVSHAEIGERTADEDTRSKAMAQDYLYYFQQIVVGDGSVNIYKANDYLGSGAEVLKTQLNGQFDLRNSDFDKAWQYSSVLKSMPANVVGKTIELNLPYNDPRCMQ